MNKGLLYLCATPIGNLEDMTFRAIRTLKEVDLIAAEDTRHTLKLINHFEINTPMTAYHEHNKVTKGPKLIEEILSGKNMALVTDAGLPGISDPGYDLVCLAVERDIKVIPLPGATASLSALIISGLPTERFAFEGFLGHKSKERKLRLDKLFYDDRTLIFYEAPHRLEDTLKDILAVLGDRETALVRELTKKHETVLRGKVSELMDILKNESPRGEYVIVLEGSKEVMVQVKPWESLSIDEHLQLLISQGIDKKEAVKVVAKERGLPKREVYEVSINL